MFEPSPRYILIGVNSRETRLEARIFPLSEGNYNTRLFDSRMKYQNRALIFTIFRDLKYFKKKVVSGETKGLN
jgi:hypothetical protein